MSSTEQIQQALPAGTWKGDAVHSSVGFAVKYMAGTFQGSFSKFDAQVADGDLRGSADVASVEVKDPNLEAHLQSPEFFDAERYPQIAFEARDVQRSGDELSLSGELTIKGQTHPVEIRGRISDPMPDPFGNERFGIQLETAVDRTEFGLTWNNPLPSGEPALANEVTLIADLQFVREA